MRAADIKRFAGWDWQRLSAAKREWWAGRTPEARLRAAHALREHMRAVRPDWPSPAERQEDLEAHIRLSRLLRRVGALRNGADES
jgi:hypothetical protein